jgi:hypothetical protein
MSSMLRIWLFAVTVLLLAEDFQYLLKVENAVWKQEVAEEYGNCEDTADPEGKKESEEEKKEERKDEDKNYDADAFGGSSVLLLKNTFSDIHSFFACFSNELESPPPEF